jgi:hypothetical protein
MVRIVFSPIFLVLLVDLPKASSDSRIVSKVKRRAAGGDQ